ncbi:hypothetical protein AVEN_54478-1 [Araneus ventricosus]|uniref:Uncharacterized protein n=1 Tax=Araneus ventricosus TaxID=182803 RepID=A0A4Y2VRI0_ARAVE|nr:hypothetical protein AVEN_54478-1 [Araneus ventricosus]
MCARLKGLTGDEEEVVVAEEEDFHVQNQAPSLLSLPPGTIWETQVVPYSQNLGPSLGHHEDLLTSRVHHQRGNVCSGSLSLCCLNCPPQSWHSGVSGNCFSSYGIFYLKKISLTPNTVIRW